MDRRTRIQIAETLRTAAASLVASSLPRVLKMDRPRTNGHHPEASQIRDHIEVYPKFFDIGPDGRRHILRHELGHWFREHNVKLADIMGWAPGEGFYDLFGAGNSEEGFAEAFATFLEDPDEVRRRYPEQAALLANWIGGQMRTFHRWVEDQVEALGTISGASDLQPINEADVKKRLRLSGGYDHLLVVEAKKFQRAWEKANDDKLVHKPTRLQRLASVEVFDAYPEVYEQDGKPQVADGRHRIATAATRGRSIEVATRDTEQARRLLAAIERWS